MAMKFQTARIKTFKEGFRSLAVIISAQASL